MEEVIKSATQLLHNGDPEQALVLLGELGESTQESKQLKSVCRQVLSQQYLYLLREAQKEGDFESAKEIADKYREYIGEDERISQLLEETKSKHESKKAALAVVEQQKKELEVKERKKQRRNSICENIFPITLGISAFFLILGALIARIPYKQLKTELWSVNKSLSEVQRKNNYYRTDIKNKAIKIQDLRRSFEEEVQVLKNKVPLLVTDIQIGNTDYSGDNIITDFGSTIYSSSTKFLAPKITAYGLKDGEVELKIKWYTMYGRQIRSESSPQGYGYKVIRQCKQNEFVDMRLDSWGSDNWGFWPADDYRIEIWYKNICLKKLDITIN